MSWENRDYNRDGSDGVPPVQFRFPPVTPLTLTLICVNLALFLAKLSGPAFYTLLKLGELEYWRAYEIWRFVTYQYLHEDAVSVFFNSIGLYFFLPTLERRWGWQRAFAFYTMGGIAAGMLFLAIAAILGGSAAPLIGASGAVFAALGAVALLYPEQQLILLVFPVPIRVAAALFAALFLLEIVGDKHYYNAAQLGGLAFGFLAPWLARPVVAKQQTKLQQWQKNRVVQGEIDEQQAVDRILEKVSQSGMQSLSGREKKTLQRASDNQRKRDAERARRYGKI